MPVSESIENYLEAILIIGNRNGFVRSVDIANYLGVRKPTVTQATKLLKERGYITMEENGHIQLLGDGLAIAEGMYVRHFALAGFLMKLGVDEDTALADACKIEHDISKQSFDAICRHADGLPDPNRHR